NKETDYDRSDVLQIELLMEDAWREVERMVSEVTLRAEKEWSRSIIDNAPNIVVGLGQDSEIVVFNEFVELLTGYKAEEVIGKEWISTFVPEEAREAVHRAWDEIIETKVAGHGFENEIITRSGERRLIQWSNTHIAEDGGFGMMLSLGMDITQRRRDEEALREANRRLEANRSAMLNILEDLQEENEARRRNEVELQRVTMAIEQAGEMVLIADPDGDIRYVNPAFEAVTGYGREEVLGQNPRILRSGKQDRAFYDDLWGTVTSGQVWQGRMVNERKDGTLHVVDSTISPVMDDSGRTVSFVAVSRDVTEHLLLTEEKASLQEQLRRAQTLESIGRLAGGVAHDFNNMLGVILGYGEMVLARLHERDPLRKEVQEIVKAAQRSATLTRQLLAFSRRQTLQPQVLDLNDLVCDLEKMLRRLIGEDIVLRLTLTEDVSEVFVDPGQIEQVIMNLAVNARDAMPGGGKLSIETAQTELDEAYVARHPGAQPGEYVLLAVTDTGCGMDQEVMDRIFDPFFTTKEEGRGTGLGLATVYGIVKQSGGNIWVYSELGRGTTFKIYFPRTDARPEPAPDATVAVHAVKCGERILVVEDEEGLRSLMESLLKHLGYQVTSAANGGEALLLIEERGLKPDLVITDVVMPSMSGRQLVERLRRGQPHLKVLYMSGYTDDTIVHHGVLKPDAPFLQKPFNVQGLGAKVREVLQAGPSPDEE
ncbi:MAG: PAS domain S-box protein, partial [Actinobacteria bacterium]|nr:PAS domain S-box protein [Actinomycetota bacterium]